MLRCRGKPFLKTLKRKRTYLTSDHMSYLHHMIIHYICEVVSRIAIRLHENLVINHIVVENDFPMNEVLPLAHSVRHEHPHNVLLSTGQALFDLRLAQVIAEAIVLRGLMLLSTLL